MPTIHTCLWFEDRAEEAVAFYTSLLPESRIEGVERPAPEAPPVLIHFTLAGVLDTQAEADALHDRLIEAGGDEGRCGWLTDAWGISWQVIPDGLHEALFGGEPEANARAYQAMLGMRRLDVAAIRAAAAGGAAA